jgi:hypothetical protein
MEKIKTNKIQCNFCKDIIESIHRHNFVSCFCGRVSVDGGKDYLKRCFVESPEIDYMELSEYE